MLTFLGYALLGASCVVLGWFAKRDHDRLNHEEAYSALQYRLAVTQCLLDDTQTHVQFLNQELDTCKRRARAAP